MAGKMDGLKAELMAIQLAAQTVETLAEKLVGLKAGKMDGWKAELMAIQLAAQ